MRGYVLSKIEETLALHIRAEKLPQPEREYRFAPPRRYRFDFAWPDKMIAVECEGGTYTRGRHVRPGGYESDCRKYNLAVLKGWKVLRFTANLVYSGYAIKHIREIINEHDTRATRENTNKA